MYKKAKCRICGFVYDPAKGDPSHGVERGTEFDDINSEWRCPLCGAEKDKFIKES